MNSLAPVGIVSMLPMQLMKRGPRAPMAPLSTAAQHSGDRAEPPKTGRRYNSTRTREAILRGATREFRAKGYDGAHIDVISESAGASKRMIYYYFGSKAGLYLEVLACYFRRQYADETALAISHLPVKVALQKLVEFTFDWHLANADDLQLLVNESILRGDYLAKLVKAGLPVSPSLHAMQDLCARGVREGSMRQDIDPLELHVSVVSLCFFYASTLHTFGKLFKAGRAAADRRRARRLAIVQLVLDHAMVPAGAAAADDGEVVPARIPGETVWPIPAQP